jgi:cytoplasmic iron level regulating protein YaaA (DUF328/UPF0246 family)
MPKNELIFLSSPAKNYNFSTRFNSKLKLINSSPNFLEQTDFLLKGLKKQDLKELIKNLQVSENLAKINLERFQKWDKIHTLENSKPAISAFFGDVFKVLEIEKYEQSEVDYIKNSIFIISGFYGLLNGLDLIQPYRLEMKLHPILKGKKIILIDFWQDLITNYLNKKFSEKTIINLASKEYSQVLNLKKLKIPIVQINFKQKNKQGEFKNIGILSKKARGLFLNWAILNKVDNFEKLDNFNLENYKLEQKKPKELTFYQNF